MHLPNPSIESNSGSGLDDESQRSVAMVTMVAMVIIVIVVAMIVIVLRTERTERTDRTDRTGQTNLTFQIEFQGNLFWAVFAILALFLELPTNQQRFDINIRFV